MPRPPKDEPSKNIIVRKGGTIKWGNGLVSGKWSLTLNEFRLVLALASQMRDTDEFESYEAPISELAKLMGIDDSNPYKIIKQAAESLLTRYLKFIWKPSPESREAWIGTPWFAGIAYNDVKSTLIWRFNDKLAPMLLDLRKSYVLSSVEPIMGFKSSYSGRWYLLAKQWLKLGTVTLAVDDLREMFQTGKKYRDYNLFFKNVVALPVSEINELSEYHIDITQIKTGRKYTHLRITIAHTKKTSRIPQAETPFLGGIIDISDIDEP